MHQQSLLTEIVVDRLNHIVKTTPHTALINTTEHQGVVWCENLGCAQQLRAKLVPEGFQTLIRQGLQSQHYYLSVMY